MSDVPERDDPPEFDRLAIIEERLTALETKGKWVVYELCYEDATEVAFYIGLTTDLELRASMSLDEWENVRAALEKGKDGYYGPPRHLIEMIDRTVRQAKQTFEPGEARP